MDLTNRNMVKLEHSLNTARYSLTPVETDLVLKMVAEIKNEDEDFKPYSFKVTDLEGYFRKQLDRRTLNEMARNLMKKPITINKGKEGFLVCNWVSSFEYKAKMGLIELSFDPKLKPYLIQLQDELYLKGDLRQILQLPSEYAKRIYMLLKQWEQKGSLEVEIVEWQRILEVPKSMKAYGDFKRKALDVAERYINEKTDLTISYEPKKTGRAYTHLVWKIRTKPSTRRDELPKFKVWFLKEFMGYTELLYEFYEGHIFLNDKGYFYDGMNKKRRFEEDEIERIWQQLLDRREHLKSRKEIWEDWKEKQKMLKEKPLFDASDDVIDCRIEEVPPPKNYEGRRAEAQEELIKEIAEIPEDVILSDKEIEGVWTRFKMRLFGGK
ncbi:MAG: replication initiation protein [Sulfuricurvum sp.]